MLPEELSADICSLKAGRGRARRWPATCKSARTASSKAGDLRVPRFVSPQTLPTRMRRRRSIAARRSGSRCPGPRCRPSRSLVEKALKPLWACWRALLAARNKREPLELDIARAPRGARREGPDPLGRAARAARRAPAGRGLHDRRQCRRGQGAGGEEGAGHVPRPRAAGPREAGRAQGLSRHLRPRVRARPGDPAGDLQPPSSSASATARAARRSWSKCCAPRCRRAIRPSGSAISGWRSATYAHFTSPIRRYADLLVHRALVERLPARRGRAARPEAEAIGGHRRADLDARAAGDGGRARDGRPLCRRLPRRPGRADRRCRITGVQPFGFFATVEDLGGDGLVPAATSAPNISATTRRRGRWSARRAARPTASASGSSCAWRRPIRSPAGCASSFPKAATAAVAPAPRRRPGAGAGAGRHPPRPAANIRHNNRRK